VLNKSILSEKEQVDINNLICSGEIFQKDAPEDVWGEFPDYNKKMANLCFKNRRQNGLQSCMMNSIKRIYKRMTMEALLQLQSFRKMSGFIPMYYLLVKIASEYYYNSPADVPETELLTKIVMPLK